MKSSHAFSCRALRFVLLGSCLGGALLPSAPLCAQMVTGETTSTETQGHASASSEVDTSNVADIVVTGKQLGFSTTSEIKRNAPQSVSVLTTTDLRNIPDTILIDIVRRVPGLQVSQGGGGGIVSIRGLSQVEERMNGRNFPSAISRNFDIATLPGDLVSGVAVYKTPTADQVEGGIAGIVDFRTRRPFDFDGFAGSVTAKGVYTNLDKKVDPLLSGYISDKWDVGDGEFGILLGGSFQRQRNALRLLYTDGNKVQTNAGGTSIDAPTAVYKRYFVNTKDVSTGYGALQWRSGSGLEMSVDLLYNDSRNVGGLQSLIAHFDKGTPTAPFALYDGSNAFKSGSYSNVPLESATNRFRGDLDALQVGYNVTYTHDQLTLSGDVAYTKSTNRYSGGGLSMTTTAPGMTYDTNARFPAFIVSGVDQTALSAYRYSAFSEYLGRDSSKDLAARGDATYHFDGALRSLQVGGRYDRRTILHTGGSTSAATIPATIVSPSQNPLAELTPDDLYRSDGVQQRQWASIGYGALGSYIYSSRALFGTNAPTNDPSQRYDGAEKMLSGYAMAAFAFPVIGLPVDGNVGVRVVNTKVTLNAVRSTNGILTPENGSTSYTDVLPSVNLRLTLAKELFLRLSYSKQVSRPNFSQLAPVTVVDAGALTGSSGNPDLKPLRASQFDASLEHYFGRDNSIYVAGFYKDVKGFIRNNVAIVNIGGQNYRITEPQNLSSGYIAGGELGYRQTFSFLPGALSGLGIQGSYTYVRGSRSANPAGYIVPYEQITRHNYQLSGFYSKYGISANVNWVWRSRLLEASSGDVSGRPDYRIPFGQLDANFVYALTPRVNLILSGVNLTQSLIRRSYQDTRFFGQDALENRRILGGIQIKLGGGI